MKTFYSFLIVAGVLSVTSIGRADHEKTCKNVHGKVTVVTADGVSVNDKMYGVGKTTRITKNKLPIKLTQLAAGDIVCVDTRGKDDLDGEVAAVVVLSPSDPVPVREKEFVREKQTVRVPAHDKNCNHVHGKVTRVEESVLFVGDKPYAVREKTTIRKGDETVTVEKVSSGDFVCINSAGDADSAGTVTSVTILEPTDAELFESREVIREREKVREKIREVK
jgi:hypothetical protein